MSATRKGMVMILLGEMDVENEDKVDDELPINIFGISGKP